MIVRRGGGWLGAVGCGLLLVVLAGCGTPEFTHVTNSADRTYGAHRGHPGVTVALSAGGRREKPPESEAAATTAHDPRSPDSQAVADQPTITGRRSLPEIN